MDIVRWYLAVDRSDYVTDLQSSLRTGSSRQDRHHLQAVPKGVEDEASAVEDF